jgi:hypothetical protein
MSIDPEAVVFAKRFEPILLFHEGERFFPIDPKIYLERSALWRSTSASPSDKKSDWGEPSGPAFPRTPQLQKGSIAALKDEVTSGKNWLGETDTTGKSPFFVIREPLNEPLPNEDRFLQLTGWEPFQNAPNEVTSTSENRYPTLDPAFYNGALTGGHNWYYAEYLTNQQLIKLTQNKTPHGLNLFRVVTEPRLSAPRLLIYHFFYPLHEEPLRGCEEAGEGSKFATFAGSWTAVAIVINSANEPLFIGLTTRNIGDPKSAVGEENRLSMRVRPWKDVDTIGDHPKIFVSRGTHGNYLAPGLHSLNPFTPGDIDLNIGTCAEIEKLDDVIPGGEEITIPGEDEDVGILIVKGLLTFGIGLAFTESAYGTFATSTPAIEPNRKPQDETGGPLFGLLLKPAGVFVPEQAAAKTVEEWATKMPDPGAKPRYDFIVDRETQVWWPPRDESRGYAGRWGPRVTNDPKTRRSGMRCPPFALLFLEAIARM